MFFDGLSSSATSGCCHFVVWTNFDKSLHMGKWLRRVLSLMAICVSFRQWIVPDVPVEVERLRIAELRVGNTDWLPAQSGVMNLPRLLP